MDSWGASEKELGVTESQVTKLSDTEVEISRIKVVIFLWGQEVLLLLICLG